MEMPPTGPTQLIRTVAFEHISSSDASSVTSAAMTSIPSIPDATNERETELLFPSHVTDRIT